LGKVFDSETHTLIESEMPNHFHQYLFGGGATGGIYVTQASPGLNGPGNSTGTGGGTAHNNMQPSTVVNFIIKH
jgi:microcystin-dependent protein